MKAFNKPLRYISQPSALALAIATALAPEAGAAALEEIIVVATKREQSIQDVPITMLSHSGEALADKGIESVTQLSEVVPSLNINTGSGTTIIMLRGVGTSAVTAGNEPSVATYIDEVYNPAATANMTSFADVERVEVLKGPQGTLFGRNATGGLLHIITRDPSHDPELTLRGGVANYGTWETGLYATTGITDNLAVNISANYKDADKSYVDNQVPGVNFLPENRYNVRAKLLYTPTDNTEVKLVLSEEHYEGSNNMIRTPLPGVHAATGEATPDGWHKAAQDIVSYNEYDNTHASLHLRHSLNNVDVVSITAYRENEYFSPYDNDGTSVFNTNSWTQTNTRFFSEELRLASTGDGSLHWIVGLFYSDFSTYIDPMRIELPGVTILNRGEQQNEGKAVFGEIDWAFTEKASLVVGLRYNEDELTLDQRPTLINGNPIFPFTTLEEDFEKLTYRVGLNYRFTDDLMVYATASRGYKGGIFNMVNLSGPPAPAVQPEELDAIEVGFKSSGWFDGRATINGAIFDYDYQNLQLVTVGSGTTTTVNAAAASIRGAELEVDAQVTDKLRLSAGVSYLDSEYDEYFGITNRPSPNGMGNLPTTDNFAGNELMRAPEITFNAALNYALPAGFDVVVNYYYNDGFYWDEDNRIKEPSYEVVNFSLNWADPAEKVRLSLWGKNMTDEKYSVYSTNAPPAGDNYTAAPPRTYGISGEYRF
ncbi:MAG: TonB-dependent receptor [Porticoccaceae bacterium]|nr:TonB-dependent receptor [Porticoccaceae bacterium]